MRKNNMWQTLLQRLLWGAAALLLIVLPLAEGWGLLQSQNATFQDLFPLWSDEIYYWHQAASFARADFQSGYYSIGEQAAPAPFAHYYAWGVAVPAFYGLIGRIVGWPLWAIPIINLITLSLALLGWIVLLRPRLSQLAAALALVGTFAPLLVAMPSSMIEILQFGWAVLLAASLTRLLQSASSAESMRWAIMALLMAALAANFRITWGLLLPVIGLLWQRHNGLRGMIVGSMVGIGLAAGLYVFTTWTSAPYNDFGSYLSAFKTSLAAGLEATWQHSRANLDELIRGEAIEIVLRLQAIGLWLGVCGTAIVQRSVAWVQKRTLPYDMGEVALYTLLLPGLLVLSVVLYDVGSWRDYRVLAPQVLLSGLLLIGRRRWGLVAVFVITSCFLLPSGVQMAQKWTQDYVQQHERLVKLVKWNHRIDAVVHYDRRPVSAWCNTLTHTVYYAFVSTYTLLAVDPGIGLSMLLTDDDMHLPFKARYLLLDNDFIARHAADLHIELLLPIPAGNLYLNRDAPCPP